MTIKREDLVAAASHGLLQYRQIDPLLVFLLQRDVLAKRVALAAGARPRISRINLWLSWLGVLLAIVTAGLFGVLFLTRGAQAPAEEGLLALGLLYAAGVLVLAYWFKRRGYCVQMRLFTAFLLASLPLALFAWRQVGG